MKFMVIALLPFVLLACMPTTDSVTAPLADADACTLYVGPERVTCTGVGEQTCLQVKEAPEEAWTLLYSNIEGFNYEAGNFYILRVSETEIDNPPADGSSLKLSLVEVVEQIPVETLRETLQASTWTLARFGASGNLQAVISEGENINSITLAFVEPGRVGGSAGCNRYNAGIELDGATVQVINPASTRMLCAEESVMAQEQAYLQALAEVERLELWGDTLVLVGNTQILVYEAGINGGEPGQ